MSWSSYDRFVFSGHWISSVAAGYSKLASASHLQVIGFSDVSGTHVTALAHGDSDECDWKWVSQSYSVSESSGLLASLMAHLSICCYRRKVLELHAHTLTFTETHTHSWQQFNVSTSFIYCSNSLIIEEAVMTRDPHGLLHPGPKLGEFANADFKTKSVRSYNQWIYTNTDEAMCKQLQ